MIRLVIYFYSFLHTDSRRALRILPAVSDSVWVQARAQLWTLHPKGLHMSDLQHRQHHLPFPVRQHHQVLSCNTLKPHTSPFTVDHCCAGTFFSSRVMWFRHMQHRSGRNIMRMTVWLCVFCLSGVTSAKRCFIPPARRSVRSVHAVFAYKSIWRGIWRTDLAVS